MTSQRYIVLSKHPVYGVRTGHYVYLTAEEGARKTESGHVEPAPPPRPRTKPKRAGRAKPPAPSADPEPRSDAGLSHVTGSAAAAEEAKE